MIVQEHLPRRGAATQEEAWGYTFWDFITGNFWYILGILIVLAIFLYARSHFDRNRKR